MDGRAGQHRALMGPARGQLRTLNPSSFCLPLHLHLSTPSPPPLAFHCHFSCFLGVGWGPDIFVKSRVLRVYLSVQCFEHVQSLRRCIPMQSCILCYIYTSTHVCMLIHMHAFCAFHIHPTPFSQDTCFQVCVGFFILWHQTVPKTVFKFTFACGKCHEVCVPCHSVSTVDNMMPTVTIPLPRTLHQHDLFTLA